MSKITITLTSYNMGEVEEHDFDSWVSFVCRKIDEACGFEVTVEADKFGTASDNRIEGADSEQKELIQTVVGVELWNEWCAQGLTFRDLAQRASGGIVANDKGNGSAGAHYLGESFDDEDDADLLDRSITLVTEEEEPEAWELARATFRDLEIDGEPELVAITGDWHCSGTDPHAHRVVYAG